MPALVRVSGPVHHFIQYPAALGAAPIYLGTAESTPTYKETPHYVAVMNSLAGSTLPFDETWDGNNMVIETVLTRYDNIVFQALRDAPFAPGANASGYLGVVGLETRLSRGTLMYARLPRLILWNSFFGTANAFADDLPGYIFYAAKLNNSLPGQGGTNANKLGLTFECTSIFQTTGVVSSSAPTTPLAPQSTNFGFACYSTSDPILNVALMGLVN